jgi:hypothetical protein
MRISLDRIIAVNHPSDFPSFVARYGTPDGDKVTENERGKLPLQLRVLEYRQAHLRVIFYPVGQNSGWKVLRCVDLSTNKALSVTDVIERLEHRLR